MEGAAVGCAHGVHARLEHRVERSRPPRNPDASLVDEGMHAVAGVPDRLVQPQRIGQQLLEAAVGMRKHRQRQHE